MLRALSLFVVGVCANLLVGLTAFAQAPAEVTLTRIHVVDVALNGECVQRSNERPPILIVGSRRILHSTKALLAA